MIDFRWVARSLLWRVLLIAGGCALAAVIAIAIIRWIGGGR